jgi:hypothetical protein
MTLTYKDFCEPDVVEGFQIARYVQDNLARAARQALVNVLRDAGVPSYVHPSGREYVTVKRTTYRAAMQRNSDNGTERREHEWQGAKTLIMGDRNVMRNFFERWGLDPEDALEQFLLEIRAVLSDPK